MADPAILRIGGDLVLVDVEDVQMVRPHRWFLSEHGNTAYVVANDRQEDGTSKRIRMHRLITGAPVGMVVDHINHDGLDNRRENLRVCTQAENNANVGVPSSSALGYRGVVKHGRKYRAKFRNRHLGLYRSIEDAARAYDAACFGMFGEFATLNFPTS